MRILKSFVGLLLILVAVAFGASLCRSPVDDNPHWDYSKVRDYPADKPAKDIVEDMASDERRKIIEQTKALRHEPPTEQPEETDFADM